MNVKTKAFWLQVREEYKPDFSHSVYICNNSEIFNDVWCSYSKEAIIELATEFKGNKYPEFRVEDYALFCTNAIYDGIAFFNRYAIRNDFIDWCINKFD